MVVNSLLYLYSQDLHGFWHMDDNQSRFVEWVNE